MAEPNIVQSKQNRDSKKMIKVDGNIWEYSEPGMGTQSRLSQHMARIKLFGKRIALLDTKIDNDTITEDELENYEEYLDKAEQHQKEIMEIFAQVYRDGTAENNSVREWLDVTPPWKLEKAFKDINKEDMAKNNDGEELTS